MALIDEKYCCKSNAIIEYVTKEIVPGTESDFCDPEWVLSTEYLCLSIEQTRNSRELEQPGSAADIIYARGRMVSPKHRKDICLTQGEYCIKFQSTPYVDVIGTVRVLPEISSRLNLESVFGTHLNLEIQLDNNESNSNVF